MKKIILLLFASIPSFAQWSGTNPISFIPSGAGGVGNESTVTNGVLVSSNDSGTSLNIGVYTVGPQYSWIQSRSRWTNGAMMNLAINPWGGTVGIGTTAPITNSTLTLGRIAGNPNIKGDNINGGHVIIDSYDATGGVFLNHYTNGNVYLATAGGNVGVGTSSPNNKLQIGPNLWGWGGNDLVIGNGNGGIAIHNNASDTYLWGSNDISIRPGNTGLSALYAKSNGNIGIGTASPSVKLEINGDVNVGVNTGVVTGYGVKLNLLGAASNGDALWLSRYNNGSNQSELRVNIGDDYGQAQDMFVVGTHHWNGGDWYPHLAVQASGNVGIGTTSPDAKLAVKGTIHAEEVKVDLNVPGPDYVFEPNYKLLSLEEIKSYIERHKHLPEVPSAKEMETNGVNVSEMNMLLLKKIEELTLYVIELKKENDTQQEEIEKLKK